LNIRIPGRKYIELLELAGQRKSGIRRRWLLSSIRKGDNTIRAQVSLEKDEYDFAKARAAALGISLAKFIRHAIREQLTVLGQRAWMRYAGVIETGDARSSARLDEIVYGSKH
jgi:hypothetical protein